MLKNYFKIAWRNLHRNKAFSFINILGLAVGMAGTILIFTWIDYQFSYDDFHANKNELYKVWMRQDGSDGRVATGDITSSPLGAALKQDFPEVKATARVYWPIDRLFTNGDKSIKANGRDVDKPFITMFSFPFIEGNKEHALDEVNNIVITQNLAETLFGNESALGKVIQVDNKQSCKVTGVVQNPPKNSAFSFDYLISLAGNEMYYSSSNAWNNNTYNTYLQLKPGVSAEKFNQKIANIIGRHTKDIQAQVFVHPISKWHLYSRFENGKLVGGMIETVRLVSIIAALILLIACINFMNLSTARSEKRAKEVGVRKVIGADKLGLITQFLCESVLTAFVACVFALILVQVTLPFFNRFTGESLVVQYTNPVLIAGLLVFVLFTGLLAGSYPAFFLSAFKPVKVLKGTFKQTRGWFTPRKVLVVVQFTVAIVLIVTTLVVYRQIRFAQERDNGYVKDNLVDISIEGNIGKNYDLIKQELLNSGAATAVTKTCYSITVAGSSSDSYSWEGKNPQQGIEFTRFNSTGDFVKTMGVKLIDGRDIDLAAHPADTAAVMLNETAVKMMNLKNPVGKIIRFDRNGPQSVTVVGVFKDFIISSPYHSINPMILHGFKNWNYNMVVRLNEHNPTSKNLQLAEGIFNKYNPAFPFVYQFVDQQYAKKFDSEVKTATIAAIFAGLTIFISCLGLFGLAAYMAESRSKEIGIRKVLGATVINVVQLLSTEFVLLVLIALAIGAPIGWWTMHNWLQNYTYHISIGWLTFVLAGGAAIVLALATVSLQAVKAAVANPVKSIRAE